MRGQQVLRQSHNKFYRTQLWLQEPEYYLQQDRDYAKISELWLRSAMITYTLSSELVKEIDVRMILRTCDFNNLPGLIQEIELQQGI